MTLSRKQAKQVVDAYNAGVITEFRTGGRVYRLNPFDRRLTLQDPCTMSRIDFDMDSVFTDNEALYVLTIDDVNFNIYLRD